MNYYKSDREIQQTDVRGGLAEWARRTGRRKAPGPVRGGLRFAFYGRVSTEDWQDPVTSRARQLDQAAALPNICGSIIATAWLGRRTDGPGSGAQASSPVPGGQAPCGLRHRCALRWSAAVLSDRVLMA